MKQIISRFGLLACFGCLYFGMMPSVFAATSDIGIVMNVEGELTARGADGSLRKLGAWGKVLVGDTLYTGKDSYARVKFSDGGQISLKPATQFKIEDYHHDEQQPAQDAAKFNLLKGGLRAVSGAIGKRGDPDSYSVKTRTATVGIRGTRYGMLFCQGDCGDIPPPADGSPLSDGTHIDVTEGSIIVKNSAGTQLLNVGQFGFVGSSNDRPVLIPAERAIKVDIPGKLAVDKVRGLGAGEQKQDIKQDIKQDGKIEPSGTPKSSGGESGGGSGEGGGTVCPI